MRHLLRSLAALAIGACALSATGCNALAGLLRTDTGALAPVNQNNSHGIAALPGSTLVIIGGPQDASGPVGASATPNVSGTAAQSTAVDPKAVADSAAQLLATVPATSPAAALARAAAATASTKPQLASQLLEAAKTAPTTPAEPVPGPGAPAGGPAAPGSTVPPASDTSAAADAPKGSAEPPAPGAPAK